MRDRIFSTALCLLAVLLLMLLPMISLAQRAIPDDNLAYPVMVLRSTGGGGSGFYLNTPSSVYLVTAKHVLFDPKTGRLRAPAAVLLSYPRDQKENGRNLLSTNLDLLMATGEVKLHPKEDVVAVRVASVSEHNLADSDPSKTRNLQVVNGVTVKERTPSGLLGVTLNSIKKFDEALIANTVIVFGYPTSLGLSNIPQLDPLRPLLRIGIVAGINPAKKLLVIDCPVYPGNSGGPVLEITQKWPQVHYRLIGVVSQFVPFDSARLPGQSPEYSRNLTNSGYAIVTPMDHVLELVN